MGGLIQGVLYLADVIASFFTILFLLRFFMQWARVSFYGPVPQFVLTLTTWGVRPLRRVIPSAFGMDLASLVGALLIQIALYVLIFSLSTALLPISAEGAAWALMLFGMALRSLLRLSIYLGIGLLIVQAVLSWVNPRSPLAGPVNQLTYPLLAPIRRFLPPISGIDLSPMVAIILAQFLLIVF